MEFAKHDELISMARLYQQRCIDRQIEDHDGVLPEENGKSSTSASMWKRYASIEQHSNAKEVLNMRAAVAARLGSDCEWVASEKVHGANFCFETDGHRINYASRTSVLGDNADFFNARETMPKYHAFVLSAFRLAQERFPTIRKLLIYGEYFGGYYPGHPVVPGRKKVQAGVAYSPDHHFYAFDVCIDAVQYLDFDEARNLLLAAGFSLVAAPLFRGSLDELLAINVETLVTTLPAQLGHPPLDKFQIAEGIVIRPKKEVQFGNSRAILKKKSQAFWEATNQPSMAAKAAHASAKGAFAGSELFDSVRCLITENRLRAVISKDPALLDESNLQKLSGLFAKDLWEELTKVESEKVSALGKNELAAMKRSLQFMSRSFVQDRVGDIRHDVG
eukprot:TRINITY_DN5008_c0_g1_i1.p1 TRINITY_DN5008_c0_g1~~TRINITY_DN5008_c0_g1_i1.p1  ORF type:complete len:390 (+),score=61.52 TRINITY_DN5008_c0_g1_i1:29-1198(+)